MFFWLISWIWMYGAVSLCTLVAYLGSALLIFDRLKEPYATGLVSLCTVAGFLLGVWLLT